MINLAPGRIRPNNRKPTETDKSPSAQVSSSIAPIAGLVTADPLAGPTPNSALMMENFWPTTSGIEPRGGTRLRATIPNETKQMFEYHAGTNRRYFVADQNNIYGFDDQTVLGSALSTEVTGQTQAEYSISRVHNQGGSFITILNGYDTPKLYDGTTWTDASYTGGVDPTNLHYAWVYRNRQFMLENHSMDVWYLGINSVSGAATKLPLGGLFKRGGSLLFGSTWSSDSGAGIDDRCVFVTDRGEAAVYTGDPADVNSWALAGVFDIGDPLGKNAHFNIGGDLIVATKDGLIPLSAAVQNDVTRLKLAALTQPIDPTWRKEVVLAGSATEWAIEKWGSRNMLTIAPPNSDGYCYVANLETGAWSKFTNWVVNDFAVFNDQLHYSDNQGNIFTCDTGGNDNGTPFECKVLSAFNNMGSIANYKTLHAIRGTWKYRTPILVKHSVATNYKADFPITPNAALYEGSTEGEWDVSFWDQDFWATDETNFDFKAGWVSIGKHGENFAYQIQLLSASDFKLDCELVSIDMTYSQGQFLT